MPPKRAAGRDQLDVDGRRRQVEQRGDLRLVLVHALALGVDLEPLALGQRQAGLGLQEGVLDALRGEARRDDVGRRGQRGVHVAAAERAHLEEVAAGVEGRGGAGAGPAPGW